MGEKKKAESEAKVMRNTIVADSRAQEKGTVTTFRYTAGRKTSRVNNNYTEH